MKDRVIFSGNCVLITLRNGAYFLSYEAGESVLHYREVEISLNDVELAMKNEAGAYEVILRNEHKSYEAQS